MSDSPTFVATFDDGEVTRMTVHQGLDNGRLDVGRGVRLAQWAYRSRMGLQCDPPADTPAIIEARYEARNENGEAAPVESQQQIEERLALGRRAMKRKYVVLETYTAEELATLTADPALELAAE
jgi:hypothetical protein